MRKTVISLLCAVLLGGCASGNTGTARLQESSGQEEAAAPAVQNYTVPGFNYGDVARKAEEIEFAIAEERWEDIASLFAVQESAEAVRERWQADGEGPWAPAGSAPVFRDGCIGAVVFLSGDAGVREAVIRMNEDLKIEVMECFMRPAFSAPEESEEWTEQLIYAGNEPKITGILTLPVPSEDEEEEEDGEDSQELPPVAVLMGEEIDDAMNESGSNEQLRRDLAHALAENGVASVRFNSRCYEDPKLFELFGYDLDFVLNEDVASIFHTLETYPVDARRIVYVGHGAAGTLGYAHVYKHFEVTGGLVLINAPFTKDGAQLLARSFWLDTEAAEEAAELLEDEDADEETAVRGYPLSWWRDWNAMGALKYTRYVAIPILIQQGKDDAIVTPAEDYENWKSQKGSNVTMKLYPGIGHDLRGTDGSFEEQLAEDIAGWLAGEDINKKKPEASPSPTPGSSGTRRS